MRRRDLIVLGGALALAPELAIAQSRPKMYRIARLSAGSGDAQEERFKGRLAELGYIENRDYVLETRALRGRIDSVPELAAVLVRSQPDVIVAAGAEAVLKAVTEATRSTPIVFVAVDYDPVALGYVAGLPRPGGNITGVFLRQVEVTAKRVELLKEMLPSLSELGILADAFTNESSEQMRAVESEAVRLGLRLTPLVLGAAPYDFAAAAKAARAKGAGAILALMSPGLYFERQQLVKATLAEELPASFGVREFTILGGLMSYGANIAEMHGLAADYVAKILTGAKPAELPVQQPTTFELVINLKTAKALGLAVPQSLLARADEVIE